MNPPAMPEISKLPTGAQNIPPVEPRKMVATKPATEKPPPPSEQESPKGKLFEELKKYAKPFPEPPSEVEKTTPAPPTAEPNEKTTAQETAKKKSNPWKLLDEFKARAAAAEKRLAELEKQVIPAEKQKEWQNEIETLRQRNEQLEKEIRFANYRKSAEFQEKYEKPYQAAWKRALQDLADVTITDPTTGETRKATTDDLMELVSLPLAKARQRASEVFGEFAADIMAHRNAIRTLYDDQMEALERARTEGEEIIQKRAREMKQKHQEMLEFIRSEWKRLGDAELKHEKYGRFFRPWDGDEDGNEKLQKGYEIVDRVLSTNPFSPNLTDDQRRKAIRGHVAVRHRAAAFGRLVHQINKLENENKRLQKELDELKGTSPEVSGRKGAPARPATRDPREEIFEELRKLAH